MRVNSHNPPHLVCMENHANSVRRSHDNFILTILLISFVGARRLELPCSYEHTDLNRARLPIPPCAQTLPPILYSELGVP